MAAPVQFYSLAFITARFLRNLTALKNASPRPCKQNRQYSQNKRVPKIYTKTGDKGTSALFTGERRSKDDDIFETLGTVDELSSAIGVSLEFCKDQQHAFAPQLERIQCILQDMGSNIATPLSSARQAHLNITAFDSGHTEDLEGWIDTHTAILPPLSNFVLPSGGKCSATLHLARAICRRAERRMATTLRRKDMDAEPLKYLNRLSDYLFTVARLAVQLEKQEETVYRRVRPQRSNRRQGAPDGEGTSDSSTVSDSSSSASKDGS